MYPNTPFVHLRECLLTMIGGTNKSVMGITKFQNPFIGGITKFQVPDYYKIKSRLLKMDQVQDSIILCTSKENAVFLVFSRSTCNRRHSCQQTFSYHVLKDWFWIKCTPKKFAALTILMLDLSKGSWGQFWLQRSIGELSFFTVRGGKNDQMTHFGVKIDPRNPFTWLFLGTLTNLKVNNG